MTARQTVTKTLPTSYPNTTYVVTLTAHAVFVASGEANNSISAKTTSTFTCTSGQTAAADLMFIAIGY